MITWFKHYTFYIWVYPSSSPALCSILFWWTMRFLLLKAMPWRHSFASVCENCLESCKDTFLDKVVLDVWTIEKMMIGSWAAKTNKCEIGLLRNCSLSIAPEWKLRHNSPAYARSSLSSTPRRQLRCSVDCQFITAIKPATSDEAFSSSSIYVRPKGHQSTWLCSLPVRICLYDPPKKILIKQSSSLKRKSMCITKTLSGYTLSHLSAYVSVETHKALTESQKSTRCA